MTDTTDIKALREASRRETFEHQAAKYEKCSLSFIVSLRNKEGGYSNEKIDDMWYGFKLAVAPPWGRTVGEVAIESNRLFHEKKALLDQLEAERQRVVELEEHSKKLYEGFHQERQRADDRAKENYRNRCDVDNCMETIANLEAELAALKGDQVPVAFTAARWLDTRCKLSVWTDRESAVMEIGDNSKVAELYGRPQNPVVLPSPYYGDRHCLDKREVIAAIEAAGGIVKDGE